MKNYFMYLVKKRFPIYLTFTAIFLALFLIVNRESAMYKKSGSVIYMSPYITIVYIISLAIALAVIPIFEFSFKMKRIPADQAYSLPIKRERLYLIRFIMGYLEVIVPFTLAYFISLIPIATWGMELCNFGGFFAFYGLLIAQGFIVYSIISFFFCQANNALDGIISVLLATFVLCPVVYLFLQGTAYNDTAIEYILFSYYNFADYISRYWLFEEIVGGIDTFSAYVPFLVISILGIAACIGGYFISKRFKSEDAGQKSESWFCYKIMLPLFLVTMTYYANEIVFFIMIIIATYLGYVLYKRSFKLDKITWIILGAVLALEVIAFFLRGPIDEHIYGLGENANAYYSFLK